ncbi:uncharacterized mitochondrial protein AtMg00820-like [Beta vulgaris subsp. vulgaris]|uniref:uncharacterized mitochondrial protein AtMg00820-like n=1 Tax=Beta vulgaris subsp. vulgaris TaxID=3555 RepID=UPI0020366E87|nr:uncharacterized mitochondrial protein AtMg00820-like [Beta vulgaris subsp. vulgaris]
MNTTASKYPLPRNPVSALRDVNWKISMTDEYNALIKNKTWELVPRPPDVNVIRSMWIFTHKEHSDGTFERHKARLLVRLALIVGRLLVRLSNRLLSGLFLGWRYPSLGAFINLM